jgi:hypothetical protein
MFSLFKKKRSLTEDHYLLIAQAIEANLLALRVMGDAYYRMPEPYKWGMRKTLIHTVREAIEHPEKVLEHRKSSAYVNRITQLERWVKKDKRWPKIKKFREHYEKVDAKWHKECAEDFTKKLTGAKKRKEFKSLMRWMEQVKKIGLKHEQKTNHLYRL